jgi:hypothetical protein
MSPLIRLTRHCIAGTLLRISVRLGQLAVRVLPADQGHSKVPSGNLWDRPAPGYASGMNAQEWDWPEPRRGRYRRLPTRSRFDVYQQPSGWNSPIVKKIIHIYWLTMVTIIKVLLAILLSIVAFGASWLFWTVITL